MSSPRAAVLGVVLSGSGLAGAPVTPMRPEAARAWESFLAVYREGLREHGIVGSAVVVVQDGGVLAQAAEGSADLSTGRAVDADTLFHWASITKTFTGIAILQLRDHGLLSLEDPVVKFVPELREVHNPFGDMAGITIRHLLTHSAGFREPTWPWGGDKPWHPFEPPRWEQLAAMLPYTEIQFPPGSRFSYSNPGVVFLGRTIERLTNEDYEVYVDKNILRPLGMRRTFFDRAPYHLAPHRSHSYFRNDDGLAEAPFDFDSGVTVSNGGLNGPLDDMARYLAFLMGDPSGRASYETVLSRSSLEEMFQAGLPVREEGEARVAMGLAFFVERRKGRVLIAHGGEQNGFLSHLYLDPAARTAYAITFNTDTSSTAKGAARNTHTLDDRLRDVLLGGLFAALPETAGR